MLYWFQCVCLSGTEIRVIRLSTLVDTMFWGVLDHLVDVRPSVHPSVRLSVRPSVCMSVHPSVRPDRHLSRLLLGNWEVIYRWHKDLNWVQLSTTLSTTLSTKTNFAWFSLWVSHIPSTNEYLAEYYWVPLSTTLSTTEYHIEYLWVQCGRYEWRGAGCVIALSMPSSYHCFHFGMNECESLSVSAEALKLFAGYEY